MKSSPVQVDNKKVISKCDIVVEIWNKSEAQRRKTIIYISRIEIDVRYKN